MRLAAGSSSLWGRSSNQKYQEGNEKKPEIEMGSKDPVMNWYVNQVLVLQHTSYAELRQDSLTIHAYTEALRRRDKKKR